MDGEALDFRAHEEREVEGQYCVTQYGKTRVSGQFIADLIRDYLNHMPNGIVLHGLAVEGEVYVDRVRADRVIALQRCCFTHDFILRNSTLLTTILKGSTFFGVIDLRDTAVEGALLLGNGFVSLTACLLRDMRVRSAVDLTGSAFYFNYFTGTSDLITQAEGECISIARMSTGSLFWREMMSQPRGIVSLREAEVQSFRDQLQTNEDLKLSWPEPGNLRAEWFHYRSRACADPKLLEGWLRLQVGGRPALSAYEILTSALERNGEEVAANQIAIARQKLLAKLESNLFNKAVRWIYIASSDAGRNVQKAIYAALVLFALCVAAIGVEHYLGHFSPSEAGILSHQCYSNFNSRPCPDWMPIGNGRNVPKDYARFNVVGYSLDAFVPLIDYGFLDDWGPARASTEWILIGVKTAGLVSFSIILICLAGVTRHQKM